MAIFVATRTILKYHLRSSTGQLMPSFPIDDSVIFRKTIKGTQEVAERTFGLDRNLRRLLIVIDGIKDVTELSAFVRSTEVDASIAQLETKGFIERLDAGEESPGRVAYAPAANDPAVFALIKRNAMVEIRQRLGPVSSLLINEIEACPGPRELREKLRNIENVLVHVLGPAEGRELARKLGSELTRLVAQST